MKIKLDDKHYLNSDVYCYWITTVVNRDDEGKKPYEKRVSGYTGTFEQAVDSFIDKRINSLEIEEFHALAKEIGKLKEEVRSWKAAVERRD